MLQLLHLHDQLPADSAADFASLSLSLFLTPVQYASIALQINQEWVLASANDVGTADCSTVILRAERMLQPDEGSRSAHDPFSIASQHSCHTAFGYSRKFCFLKIAIDIYIAAIVRQP